MALSEISQNIRMSDVISYETELNTVLVGRVKNLVSKGFLMGFEPR